MDTTYKVFLLNPMSYRDCWAVVLVTDEWLKRAWITRHDPQYNNLLGEVTVKDNCDGICHMITFWNPYACEENAYLAHAQENSPCGRHYITFYGEDTSDDFGLELMAHLEEIIESYRLLNMTVSERIRESLDSLVERM